MLDRKTAKLLKLSLEALRDSLRVPLEIGSDIEDMAIRRLLGSLGAEIIGTVEVELLPRILEQHPDLASTDDQA
ncbi:hypothetical protein [Microvirga sp. M2]|uniref:hypothetical protein n=1 Tax=Microvirga sp. M2 TaxID=3073270 RepID=UPI0039C01B49